MTRLHNDPAAFADELVEGFVAANRHWVRAVAGGVVRRRPTPEGQVALIVGGGSGHYPAYGGLVGPGLAHGAAMGNIFASPSAQQVHHVAKTAANGGGVLLSYGNYAGDVLHFDQAEQRLNDEGIPCRSVVVTDDISSAPPQEKHKRRGIAGGLCVFKIAGAAAEAGYSLEEVARVANLANERTRSLGVAFSGCTLPGAPEPLFEVAPGRMEIGMGIHGEAGIDETDVPTADGLAQLFVSRLLGELPEGVTQVRGARVGVILNGLGSVKYEELFVVYRRVAQLLDDAGLVVVGPEVGELVTSFDMAGASLTLFWLDDELERLWSAGADSPGYRKGSVGTNGADDDTGDTDVQEADEEIVVGPASDASHEAAQRIAAALDAVAETINTHAEELGRLDAIAGDGDHGIGMRRGATAARATAHAVLGRGAGARTLLQSAGDAWANKGGGTSGALWGLALRSVGDIFGDEGEPSAADVAAGVVAASDAIRASGKASVGDKTMVDALVPFADTLQAAVASGALFAQAWTQAADAAGTAAAGTADLMPQLGRARAHAEKSIGTVDPGAHSFALIVTAIAEVLKHV